MLVLSPFFDMVLRGVNIEEVGFTENLVMISCPVEIPPNMPPELLDLYSGPSSPIKISSEFSSPVRVATAIPFPISTPLTALILIIAEAKSESSLPYIGAPSPAGTPEATTSIVAPMELPFFLI